MAQYSACCSPCQNPHDGKNELTGRTPTKGSDRRTPASAATHAFTVAATPVVAPLAASGSADSFVVRYSEDDLQRILRTVLDFGLLVPILALVIAAAPYSEKPRKRPLKAWFPNIYWGKTHLECYNFFQQCKDLFAIAGVTGLNRFPFAATFLKDIALFQ